MTINVIYGQCEEEYSTVGILTDLSEETYNDDESVNAYSIFSWTSDDVNRILSGNGIPNHEVVHSLMQTVQIPSVNKM